MFSHFFHHQLPSTGQSRACYLVVLRWNTVPLRPQGYHTSCHHSGFFFRCLKLSKAVRIMCLKLQCMLCMLLSMALMKNHENPRKNGLHKWSRLVWENVCVCVLCVLYCCGNLCRWCRCRVWRPEATFALSSQLSLHRVPERHICNLRKLPKPAKSIKHVTSMFNFIVYLFLKSAVHEWHREKCKSSTHKSWNVWAFCIVASSPWQQSLPGSYWSSARKIW